MAAGDRPALTRGSIVAAARDLISADGLEALSLRRLAGDLGVTAPALYAHVAGKGDLLRAVAEGELGRLSARFDQVTVADPVERIRAYNRSYVQHAQENPELFRVMFLFPPDLGSGQVHGAGELPAATTTFALAASAVAHAVQVGAIEVDDPLLASLTLWSGAHGVVSVLQLGFDLPPELVDALIDEVTDRLLRGYAPGPG